MSYRNIPAISLRLATVAACCWWACPRTVSAEDTTPAPQVLFEDHFEDGLANWVVNGPPGVIVSIDEQGLMIDPRAAQSRPKMGIEGVNLWCRTPIEGDLRISYDLEPISPRPDEGKFCNLLFMLCYRYVDPKLDVIENTSQRTGAYFYLHGGTSEQDRQKKLADWGFDVPRLRGYTITYYRIAPDQQPPFRIVVRRNPGFQLLGQLDQTAQDQWNYRHTVTVEKVGPRIRIFQGDNQVLTCEDTAARQSPPLEIFQDGYFGLRSWQAQYRLYSVTVTRPAAAEPDPTPP